MIRVCVRFVALVLLGAVAVPVTADRVSAGVAADVATVVTLEVSPNPAVDDQTLVFEATVDAVDSDAVPTGTVRFKVYGNQIGTVTLEADDGGIATFALAGGLPIGDYLATAVFEGDVGFADDTSDVVPFTVQPATKLGRFIDSVYRAELSRPVDDPGLNFWTAEINRTGDRNTFTFAVLFTQEVRTRNCLNLYQYYLGRVADSPGLLYCVGLLQQGFQLDSIETVLTGSPEYLQLAGGTNDGFLNRLYSQVLGRPIDSAARAFYLQRIAEGAPRAWVAATVMISAERLHLFVDFLYESILGRAPDSAGETFWVGELAREIREEALVALLYGSDEYFAGIT